MENEIWKDVIGFEGLYQVSNNGIIRSLDRFIKYLGYISKGQLLKQSFDSKGYKQVCLTKDGKKVSKKVHKLVAMAFLNHTPCGMRLTIDHIDRVKTNNNVENLRIVTNRENSHNRLLKNKSSKFLGVSWSSTMNKWSASIFLNGKPKQLGYYDSEINASFQYQKELKKIKL